MFGPQGPTLSVHSGNRNDIRCVAALVLRHMNPQMIGNARHRMQTCLGFMISPRGDMPVGNECEACVRQEPWKGRRSEEHTSELQSLMRISYAVFCLKKNTTTNASNMIHH